MSAVLLLTNASGPSVQIVPALGLLDYSIRVAPLEAGALIEVQGTAEHGTFDRKQLDAMLDLAALGIRRLAAAQREVLSR